jgi:AraC-like DNA-binding protein/mannose-6-phosphate isomerase-like protein (cupin superfamily)
MHWSLSEFLNLIDLRGQSWCFVNMGARSGFHLLHSEAVLFHAVLEGTTKITSGIGQTIGLKAGDIVMVLSGNAHAVRNHQGSSTELIDLLNNGEYVDSPPMIALGKGPPTSRLLCGRLKVRGPGGFHSSGLPAMLSIRCAELGFDLGKFAEAVMGAGAAALLTRLATLLFVSAFRDHPRCQAQFRWDLHDPIARSKVFIEKHPFQPWTVQSLANKVGMGRSNFAARFTAQIGKTPIDALTEERMRHAESFLHSTDLKIAEVSERVGYRSETAFIRRFTNHFGVPPGKFRRQAR